MKILFTLLILMSGYISYSQDFLTWGEINDFEIGDEFHYSEDSYFPPVNSRKIILEKSLSPNGDTISYVVVHTVLDSFSWDNYGNPTGAYYSDKITTPQYLNLNVPINDMDTLFNEFGSIIYPSSQCEYEVNEYYYTVPVFEGQTYAKSYGKGLGLVWDYHVDPTDIIYGFVQWNFQLKYFKKGDEECGWPLFTSLEVETPKQESLQFFPNPTRGQLQFSKDVSSFTILNMMGQVVFDGKNQYNRQVDLGFLCPGVYTIIMTGKGNALSKKLIKW